MPCQKKLSTVRKKGATLPPTVKIEIHRSIHPHQKMSRSEKELSTVRKKGGPCKSIHANETNNSSYSSREQHQPPTPTPNTNTHTHTHIPRQRWLGKSEENQVEFRISSGSMLSGNIHAAYSQDVFSYLLQVQESASQLPSRTNASVFVGARLALSCAPPALYRSLETNKQLLETEGHTHTTPFTVEEVKL